jgi:hypothetical protein
MQIRQNSHRPHATLLAPMHDESNPCSAFTFLSSPRGPFSLRGQECVGALTTYFRRTCMYVCSSLFLWLLVSVNVASVLSSLAFVSYSGRAPHDSKFHTTTLKLHQSNQALHNASPIRSHKYQLANPSQWIPCQTVLNDSIFRRLKWSHLFQAAQIMHGISSSNQFPDTSSAYSTRHPQESRTTSGSNPKMLSGISQMQELTFSREAIESRQPTVFGDI